MRHLLVAAALVLIGAAEGTQAQRTGAVPIKTIKEDGGRLEWAPRGDLIAYDRAGSDGYFDIYTMASDGSGDRCITCNGRGLPNRHIGNPSWHPSSDYIVFQAQRAARGLGALTDFFANPGSGVANDVWLMDVRGQQFWQLTNTPRGYGGVLHPHFSHDGTKLLWSERVGARPGMWGQWALKVAQFTLSKGSPRLSSIRTLQPGANRAFYESHGFDPGGRRILFSGNLDRGQSEMALDIFWMDLQSGALSNLTRSNGDWDEHAQLSPDGRRIIWMSSRAIGPPKKPVELKSDYWIMNADGSNQRRLTFFNQNGHPHYIEGGAVAADSSWSPDGTRIAAYLILDPEKVRGRISIIDVSLLR